MVQYKVVSFKQPRKSVRTQKEDGKEVIAAFAVVLTASGQLAVRTLGLEGANRFAVLSAAREFTEKLIREGMGSIPILIENKDSIAA